MLKMTAISNGGSYSNYMTGAEGQKADYYMQSEELKRAPEWVGEGAKELGLQGEVKTADLQAVLAGNLPNGEQLGRAAGDGQTEHRAGWDGTFSAPKSVSVAALVGGDQRLSDAHATAVREALQHIEKHKLETRVTTGGVTQREQTGSMVAAVFQHAASRASDPQLHSHALIANATKGQDGKWRSVESLSIYQDIKGLGQVYRETLAPAVTALRDRRRIWPPWRRAALKLVCRLQSLRSAGGKSPCLLGLMPSNLCSRPASRLPRNAASRSWPSVRRRQRML